MRRERHKINQRKESKNGKEGRKKKREEGEETLAATASRRFIPCLARTEKRKKRRGRGEGNPKGN